MRDDRARRAAARWTSARSSRCRRGDPGRRSSGSPPSASTATPTGSRTRRRVARGSRVCVRRAARAAVLASGALRGRARPTGRAPQLLRLHDRSRELQGLRRRDVAAPDAMLDDGLLEVLVLESISKLGFLTRILPKVFKGTHVEEPCVVCFGAREITISADRAFTMYADGDPIGELPVRVRALQGAITMLVPAAGPADPAFASPSPTSTVAASATTARRHRAASPARPADAGDAPTQARACAGRRRSLAPRWRRRDEHAGKGADGSRATRHRGAWPAGSSGAACSCRPQTARRQRPRWRPASSSTRMCPWSTTRPARTWPGESRRACSSRPAARRDPR